MFSRSTAQASPEQQRGTLEGRIVDAESLAPIEGATVVVTDSRGGPLVVSGTTDGNGWYRYLVPPGSYDLLAVFGDSRWIHRGIVVTADRVTQTPGALAVGAEVVTIHEHAATDRGTAAQVVKSTVKPVLPYSDQAIDEETWAIGWLLLDVDERGIVTGFRFLHRPGSGLDAIAEREVWSLLFEPARNASGAPVPSKVLWKLEWPSFHWNRDHVLHGLGGQGALTTANQVGAENDAAGANNFDVTIGMIATPRPPMTPMEKAAMGRLAHDAPFVLPGEQRPPCKVKAPLNLDMHVGVARDCSPPDISKVNTEPLIPRPAAP